ncbi:MAG: hypothetical protein COA33_000065 [Fluviicola sp.]|nr:hypothetical protein [Fluviicola sp.]
MDYLKLTVLFLGLLLIGCNSKESSNNLNDESAFLSEADSIAVLNDLIEEMKEENYTNLTSFNFPNYGCMPMLIEKRDIFSIQQDLKGEIIINGLLDSKSITNEIVTYFSANREKNDVANNYPMYSRISRKEIIHLTKEAIEEAKKVKNTPGALEDIIDFKERQVEEWMKKLRAIKVLQIDKLPEPSVQAHITIEYQDTLKGEHLIDSVLVGFFLLRDYASKKYFNESYLTIFQRNRKNETLLDTERLKALSILYPLTILDKEGLKKRGLKYVYSNIVGYPEPPPPPVFEK